MHKTKSEPAALQKGKATTQKMAGQILCPGGGGGGGGSGGGVAGESPK